MPKPICCKQRFRLPRRAVSRDSISAFNARAITFTRPRLTGASTNLDRRPMAKHLRHRTARISLLRTLKAKDWWRLLRPPSPVEDCKSHRGLKAARLRRIQAEFHVERTARCQRQVHLRRPSALRARPRCRPSVRFTSSFGSLRLPAYSDLTSWNEISHILVHRQRPEAIDGGVSPFAK